MPGIKFLDEMAGISERVDTSDTRSSDTDMVNDLPVSTLLQEIGSTGTKIFSGIIDSDEYNPDLKPPRLYDTIDQMRKADAQVRSTLVAAIWPVLMAPWFVVPGGSEPEQVEQAKFAHQALFNCSKTSFRSFLRQAMTLYLSFGHMVFEEVYQWDDDKRITWKKLAPRLPRTILRWEVNDEDQLEYITQLTPKLRKADDHSHHETYSIFSNRYVTEFVTIDIPADKLIVFTNEMEGSDYLGTSILRGAYKHWFYKELLYKIDAIKHERWGAGIPIIRLVDGYRDQDKNIAQAVLEGLRTHEKAMAILPQGFEPGMWPSGFPGISGGSGGIGTQDLMESINHHNQMISSNIMAHFMDLGRSKFGSRNLGETQVNVFLMVLQGMCEYNQDVLTRAVKKLIDLNWQNVEIYPRVGCGRIAAMAIDVLSRSIGRLVTSGAMTPDENLESTLRELFKFPQRAFPDTEGTPGDEEEAPEETDGKVTPLPKKPKKPKKLAVGTPPAKVAAIEEGVLLLSEPPSTYRSMGKKKRVRRKRTRKS